MNLLKQFCDDGDAWLAGPRIAEGDFGDNGNQRLGLERKGLPRDELFVNDGKGKQQTPGIGMKESVPIN